MAALRFTATISLITGGPGAGGGERNVGVVYRRAHAIAHPGVRGRDRRRRAHPRTHFAITTSGFPFSTMYVASSPPRPRPTFFAEWIVPAGTNRTSPALSVTGGLPCTRYSSVPSST